MTMQASTLRILEAANFPMPQALALGQAIEEEVKGSQFVTVPILDARLAELKREWEEKFGDLRIEMAKIESRITHKLYGSLLVANGITIAVLSHVLRK